MPDSIHEAHESISNLSKTNTSDYRIRVTKVRTSDTEEKMVYKVDSKLKQTWLQVLSTIKIREQPKYLNSIELNELSSKNKLFTKVNKENKNLFHLAVISLKKELNTTNNPEMVLQAYSVDVRKQVVDDLKAAQKSIKMPSSNKLFREVIKEAYRKGIDLETGRQDLGKVADRIMGAKDQEKALEDFSEDVRQKLYLKLHNYKNLDTPIVGIDEKKELSAILKSGYDLKTGKQDLEKIGNRLLQAEDLEKALAFYSDELKEKLLAKTMNIQTHRLLQSCHLDRASTTEKLKVLISCGVNAGTGKISDFETFIAKSTEYEEKLSHQQNQNREDLDDELSFSDDESSAEELPFSDDESPSSGNL